jgi:hypothetical protein
VFWKKGSEVNWDFWEALGDDVFSCDFVRNDMNIREERVFIQMRLSLAFLVG